jgi:hypothetical protein
MAVKKRDSAVVLANSEGLLFGLACGLGLGAWLSLYASLCMAVLVGACGVLIAWERRT